MSRRLLTLFGAAYCTSDTVKGPSISIHHAKALYRIQEMVQNDLKHYKGFLSVKGERNVTMTRYPFLMSIDLRQPTDSCYCFIIHARIHVM